MIRPDLWKAPIDKEIQYMHEHKVWCLVEHSEEACTMKNHWAFALKYDSNSKVAGWKARLVMKGFSQILGMDYFATYASVVITTYTSTALGTVRDFEMWQIDYMSAYLNALMQAPILME